MSQSCFNIKLDGLVPLFDLDNIRDGKSLALLNELNGVSGLCSTLKTSTTNGISTDPAEIKERVNTFGSNQHSVKERAGIFDIIWDALQDTVLQILIGAAIVSLIMGTLEDTSDGWLEGMAILVAVAIVLAVTATNDYMKESQFIKLNQETNIHNVVVTRNGLEIEISAYDLLVGDLMRIGPGEVFPVDGILVRGNGLTVDESAATGESKTIIKEIIKPGNTKADPFLISGGQVVEGNGLMIVCVIGVNSNNERLQLLLGKLEEPDTPLQERLEKIASALGKIGFVAGGSLTLILIMYTGIDALVNDDWGREEWKEVVTAFILGVTILVVAIPEGLPLALTLAMAYSIFKMKDENIFVRHLKGCEVMGAATNILSDKTGTLTQNQMKVIQGQLFGQEFLKFNESTLFANQKAIAAEVIARNTTAFVNKTHDKIEIVGNRTEGALLEMINYWGFNLSPIRNMDKQVYQFPFNSSSKRMTTVYEHNEDQYSVYCKGAAEIILDNCSYCFNQDGNKVEMSQELKSEFKKLINGYSANCLRVLGLANKICSIPSSDGPVLQEHFENDLTLIGIIGIKDPLRPEARNSIIRAQKAGVIVRMVTGDRLETAVAIAKQANILPDILLPEDLKLMAIKGKELRQRTGGLVSIKNEQDKLIGFKVKNIDEFKEIITHLRVVARCSPEDKMLLVIGLKELGEVVGVTGDGSNDSAALKQSDIGLAMISGTQLAKESSDIILLDDNFESVLNSIKWGRNIYASTRKFLQFQMTVNIVAIIVSIIGSLSVETSPLTAIQMLWVNLIMDSFAALALATEPPSDEILESKPFGRTESIVIMDMIITIISQVVFQTAVLLAILYALPYILDIDEGWDSQDWDEDNGIHFTIFFHTFVMMQLFNEINCRKIWQNEINVFKGVFNNWMFIAVLTLTFVVQIILVEFGGKAVHCAPLALKYHAICIGVGFADLCFALLVRITATLIRNGSNVEESPNVSEDTPLIQ